MFGLCSGRIGLVELATGMAAMVVVTAFLGALVGCLWLWSGSIFLVTVWHHLYDYFRDMFGLWFHGGRLIAPATSAIMAVIIIGGMCCLAGTRRPPEAGMGCSR